MNNAHLWIPVYSHVLEALLHGSFSGWIIVELPMAVFHLSPHDTMVLESHGGKIRL